MGGGVAVVYLPAMKYNTEKKRNGRVGEEDFLHH